MSHIYDWINVGSLSSERDENLSSYFYDNGTLDTVIKNKKHFLLLGRKGAGKTALFKYFTDNPSQFIGSQDTIIPISMDDYSWNVHSMLSRASAAESLVYKDSWRFIFFLLVINYLGTKENASKEIKTAKQVLEKIFSGPIPSMMDFVKNKIFKLSKLKLPKGGLDISDGSLNSIELGVGEVEFHEVEQNEDLKSALVYNIEGLIKFLEQALMSAIRTRREERIFICFDRIDEAWDSVSKNISEKIITGLIAAADSITAKYDGFIRPIIFIREDIFEVLPVNDKNKLREDCGSLLKWDKDSLINMLLRRINYFASCNNQSIIQDLDSLFDKEEMRQRLTPTNYILKRTMFRPRDFVCFFSKIITSMKESNNDPFGEAQKQTSDIKYLTIESIYSAEPQYSEWLQRELIDEWSVQKPYFKNYLSAFQNNGMNIFSKEDIVKFFVQENILSKDYSNSDVLEHLKFLFNNSVIGFKLGEQNYWRYKCVYNTQGFIDSLVYRIHDGLFKTLNLKENRA